jgi:excisionase family DNA binding protein
MAVTDTVADRSSQLLTLPETTDWLRVSKSSVLRLVADGELESIKVGGRRLIFRDAIDRYIERHRDNGPAIAKRRTPFGTEAA